MTNIYDVNPNELIERVAEDLKKNDSIKPPEWAAFVKTGLHKERRPTRADWWYIRSAAVLRSVWKLGPIGVSKLRVKYGGRKNNGMAPEHHARGTGSILRKALQQLETAGLVKKGEKRPGRVITPQGMSLLGKAAVVVRGPKKVQAPPVKAPEPKKVVPKKLIPPKQIAKAEPEKKTPPAKVAPPKQITAEKVPPAKVPAKVPAKAPAPMKPENG